MGVGDKIQQRRLELGLTQDQLAEKMGYAGKTTISKIERGERDFTQTTLLKFAEVLHVDVNYFFDMSTADTIRNEAKEKYGVLFDMVEKIPEEDLGTVKQILERFAQDD